MQADWGPSGGRAAAAPSYGEAEAEEEGSKSMVLTTHTIMRVSLCGVVCCDIATHQIGLPISCCIVVPFFSPLRRMDVPPWNLILSCCDIVFVFVNRVSIIRLQYSLYFRPEGRSLDVCGRYPAAVHRHIH